MPRRIVFVVGETTLAGTQRQLLLLVSRLDRKAVDPLVIAWNGDPLPGPYIAAMESDAHRSRDHTLVDELHRHDVPLRLVDRANGRWGRVRSLRRLLRECGARYVHCF